MDDRFTMAPNTPPDRQVANAPRAEHGFVDLRINESDCTISRCVERVTQRLGESVALAQPFQAQLCYAGLYEKIIRTVEMLNRLGIGRGDRVALVLSGGLHTATIFLGVAAGAICAPLNPRYREQEFVSFFAVLKPKAVIVETECRSEAVLAANKLSVSVIELVVSGNDSRQLVLHGEKLGEAAQGGFAKAEDTALLLFTSGTTARPKLVPLTHANLLASARQIAAALELTPDDHCLNIMPLFHIHGLVAGLLSALVSGGNVVCPTGSIATNFFSWVEEFRPTWYTAVPAMHQAILAETKNCAGTIARKPLRFIRSCSAPLRRRLARELESVFNVPVIEAYGMTEAAHQIANNPLPPGQRKLGSVGMAAGPKVSTMDEHGNLLSSGEVGEIVIQGAHVTSGYLNGPESGDESFERGWFRTGDQGYLDTDGYLFITGRLKEIINRGGEKIAPREVEDVILHHRAVAEAIAFAVPHETLGEDVAVAVVLREKAAATERELQQFVAAHLAEFKIPGRVVFVDEIPKSATGKPQRLGFAQTLGHLLFLSEHGVREFLAPQTQAEKTLAAIWSQVLEKERIGVQHNFFCARRRFTPRNSGHLACASGVSDRIPSPSLFEMQTVRQLAMAITEIQGGTHPGALADMLPDIESPGVRK